MFWSRSKRLDRLSRQAERMERQAIEPLGDGRLALVASIGR